ncbi:NYN domain-containing protein [Craterilacuibacter sinensis]|uniref:NYN domain-containing protein n=1 Tax=Craterilacuibacter sinensis TaxID=2686017 RepID=A0A845BIK4_9NEIS|nr:NYN domain-containing protein [Craterilacuibacter sinensis]MXR36587.1 NYN domain-containing protein [Craterilacuibacter sinensis]RQW19691.1 NYN domain-containing protein [Rhodobacteraceae bacterium CH30]
MANVAVLIDADNVSPAWIEDVLEEAGKLGVLALKRVYGDFSKHDKAWRDLCARFAIHPIQQFPNTKGKNASDISMVIDAMDLLHSERFHSFCLVSSDSDFSRLATRLREDGLDVWGFGEQKTPVAFVNACSKFVYVEVLREPDEAKAEPETAGKDEGGRVKAPAAAKPVLRPLDRKLRAQFQKAIEASGDDDGWADLGGANSLLGQWMPDFDPRNYGYRKISELVEKSGWFEVKKATQGRGGISIKLKPANGRKK